MKLPSIAIQLKNVNTISGLAPVIISVIFKRKIIPVTTPFKVLKEDFKNGRILGQNAVYKNRILNEMVADMELGFIKAAEKGNLTTETVKRIARGGKDEALTFQELYKYLLNIYAGVMAKRTLQSWNSAADKFEKFAANKDINDISHADLLRYQSYLKNKCNNNDNTVWSEFKVMKSMCNKAVKHGMLSNNPLRQVEAPGYKDVSKVYLEENEIKLIEDYADDERRNSTLRTIAAWFALACRSGMRYADLKAWHEPEYAKGDRLYFTDKKTKTPHFIPLYPALKKAIVRVREFPTIFTNQKSNYFIKMVAVDLDINKHVTMHTARHTFAVNYLNHGGDIKVLQKLMGHKKLATTEVYGKITDKRIEEEALRVFSRCQ